MQALAPLTRVCCASRSEAIRRLVEAGLSASKTTVRKARP
jgi:hypothetical protein